MSSAHAPSGASAASGVEQLVRAALRSLRAVHALESALCAAAAALLVLAAGVHAGASLAQLHASAIAPLVGLLAGWSWHAERTCGAPHVARELDAALEQAGALETAFEHARSAEPMVRALEARVLARVGTARARRALLPSPLLVAPAPFVAGALLALALERRELELRPAESARLHVQLASALDEARGEAVALGSSQASALLELAQRARALSEPAAAAPAPGELEQIEAELSAALARERQPAALERALERARNAAQAALESAGGARAARDLAGQDLTTSTPPTPPSAAASARASSGGAASASSEARWWPETYDRIVVAWVEAQRTRSESTAPVQPAPADTKDSPP